MPIEFTGPLLEALKLALLSIIAAATAMAVAKLKALESRYEAEQRANARRDLQRDEVQANVRVLTNGSGVHHKNLPKAEPQFNGQPPVIVEHERRQVDREPTAHLPIASDVPATDAKYIDPRGPLDPRH